MKPYLWWWALLLAVLIFSAWIGASGTTRTVLEGVAVVVFFVLALAIGVLRRMSQIERRQRGE